jgi:hypothetical protein
VPVLNALAVVGLLLKSICFPGTAHLVACTFNCAHKTLAVNENTANNKN